MDRLIRTALKALSDLSGTTLAFLMAITVIDIVARHLHLFSIRGVVEISTLAVIMIGFLPLPNSFITGGHIVVDLATQGLSARTKRKIDAFWLSVLTLLLAYIALRMWQATADSYRSGDYSLDLQLPMVLFWLPASLGMSLAPVATLVAAWKNVGGRR